MISSSFHISNYLLKSCLPCPSPGDLLDSGIKPGSPALWADSVPFELLVSNRNKAVIENCLSNKYVPNHFL